MDKENVINGLCDAIGIIHGYVQKRYWGYGEQACRDAIALLKEPEAVEPFHKCIGKDFSLIEDSYFDYCPYCGKPITWAKLEGR